MSTQSMKTPRKLGSTTNCEVFDSMTFAVDDWLILWRRCRARVRTWKLPPCWSHSEWAEETQAQGALAAYQAFREFDPSRGVPLAAFLYQKVVTAVWTLYRREWTLGRRSRELEKAVVASSCELNDHAFEMSEYIESLSESDRSLLFHIYWQGRDEKELAASVGITQQGVNRRKRTILKNLKNAMVNKGIQSPNFSDDTSRQLA